MENTTKTGPKFDALEASTKEFFDYHERSATATLARVRKKMRDPEVSLNWTMRDDYDSVYRAEHMLAMCARVRTFGIDRILESVEERFDDWWPTQSTCLRRRADGDLEREVLRDHRDKLRSTLALDKAAKNQAAE